MKKALTVITSVTDFILSIELFAVAVYFAIRFIDTAKMLEIPSALLILLIIFFLLLILLLAVIFSQLIASICFLAAGIFDIAAGTIKIRCVISGDLKKLRIYAIICAIINAVVAFAALFGILFAINNAVSPLFKYGSIVLCATAAVNVTLNSILSSSAKPTKSDTACK